MNDDHDMTRASSECRGDACGFRADRGFADTGRRRVRTGFCRHAGVAGRADAGVAGRADTDAAVAETEAMPVEKVAVPQTETKSLPVDSASTEKLSAEPLAAGAVSDESAAPVDDGQTETEPAADAFGSPAAASDQRTGDVPAGATTAGDVPDKGAASCRRAIHRRGRHATA